MGEIQAKVVKKTAKTVKKTARGHPRDMRDHPHVDGNSVGGNAIEVNGSGKMNGKDREDHHGSSSPWVLRYKASGASARAFSLSEIQAKVVKKTAKTVKKTARGHPRDMRDHPHVDGNSVGGNAIEVNGSVKMNGKDRKDHHGSSVPLVSRQRRRARALVHFPFRRTGTSRRPVLEKQYPIIVWGRG